MGVLTPVLCLRFCAGHVPAATAMSFSWTRTAALCGAFIAVDRKNRSGGGFVRGWHVSMLIDEAACVCRETYIYIYIIYYIIYISSMLYIYIPPVSCSMSAQGGPGQQLRVAPRAHTCMYSKPGRKGSGGF
jgi:hypothetical protein